MNLLAAAQSGWGKSAKAQNLMEKNAPEYEHMVVLDYKDEYRGFVKAGLSKWWIVGPREMEWSESQWLEFLTGNPKIVLVRHPGIDEDDWRDVCATIISAARRLSEVLIVVDEAHFVAPQSGKTPKPTKGLATTGRGEGASSIWVSQRPAEMEETVISQCQSRILGGFESSADLDKVAKVIEYPVELHNPQVRSVPNCPDSLKPETTGRTEGSDSLQRHEDDEENTIGSEWIYSDNSGERRRIDTTGMFDSMESEHLGKQGKKIKV
ncbi:ATP-binding protein [Haloarchaeobius sp. HME9146]|uniref:ATP-binding protein n=1 Tax=Haloarchaeobius sp. HME9146 TaxID=2978732 RepID=UPI0021C0554B|nr:ATP-binding protein [Haloarchaeobius sp. HME9146]MCT9095274.1 ATP-binding protein [Haloarchaeobius sp. HME9146]